MQRSDFRHVLPLAMRWGDQDAFGHLNNVQYLRFIESGRVAYFEDLLSTRLRADADGLVLADIQCSFLQQVHYPCELEVMTRVSRLGRSSLDILCALFRQGEARPVASSKGVVVWFDFHAQRTTAIPDTIREAIMAFEPVTPLV